MGREGWRGKAHVCKKGWERRLWFGFLRNEEGREEGCRHGEHPQVAGQGIAGGEPFGEGVAFHCGESPFKEDGQRCPERADGVAFGAAEATDAGQKPAGDEKDEEAQQDAAGGQCSFTQDAVQYVLAEAAVQDGDGDEAEPDEEEFQDAHGGMGFMGGGIWT